MVIGPRWLAPFKINLNKKIITSFSLPCKVLLFFLLLCEWGRSFVTVWLDAIHVVTWVSKNWMHETKQVNKHLCLILTHFSHLVLCFLSLCCDLLSDAPDWKAHVLAAPASTAARARIIGHGSSVTAKRGWLANTVKNVCKRLTFHWKL